MITFHPLKTSFSLLACLGLLNVAPVSNAAEPNKLSDGLYAEMETSQGKIVLQLEFEKTPLTVANFVGLAEGTKDSNKPKGTKFYDGLAFHRVIPNFMIQGGCPLGTGTGGPGYRFDGEFSGNARHDRPGLLSMANAGPGTDGSQFFLTFVPTPWLDGKHTIFGEVTQGHDALKALEAAGSSSGRTSETLVLEQVTIEVA